MEERRRYYRISDRITLKYQILEDEIFAEEKHHAETGYIRQSDLRNTSNCIDARLEALVHQLSKTNPLVAEAVALINKKFSLLELIANNEIIENAIDITQQSVNLSGSGIAFISDKPMLDDTPLKLEIVLLPETQYVSVLGRVVACRELEDGHFMVAVDFEGISEDEREHIIQHILKKQTLEIRQSANVTYEQEKDKKEPGKKTAKQTA